MIQTNPRDDNFDTLGDGLLIISSSSKYGRLWRRFIVIGIFISLRKGVSAPSSLPYVPLSPTPPASSEQSRRTTSARSQHVIDIDHVDDDEEQEVDRQQRFLETVVQIGRERNLYELQKIGGVARVASVLGSNLETGIDGDQTLQVWNTSNPVDVRGFFYFFFKACNNYTIFLLLISAALSFDIGFMKQGLRSGWHDGVAILVAVFLLVTFPSVANFLRSRKLGKELWEKKKNKLEVKVVRSGEHRDIAISDIVVGDIIHLKEKDLVPADGLFVKGSELVIDEVLNAKIDHQNPFLCYGSKVVGGNGCMLATSVGSNTELGKLLNCVTRDPNCKTLLEAQIDRPNSLIDHLALCVSVLIAAIVLISLFSTKRRNNDEELPELKGNVSIQFLIKIFESVFFKPSGKIRILTSALTAVVIAIQHGMPFVVTVSLSYWNEKLESYQAKAQNLSACGTMGLVTVICINEGGGLMCNEMVVSNFFIGEKDMNNDEDCETHQLVLEALHRGIGSLPLVPEIFVSPTNDLLTSWANSRWNMNEEFPEFSVRDYRQLSSSKKGCGVLLKKGDDAEILHLHWHGVASTILDMCSHYFDHRGKCHVLEDQKRKFKQVIKDMEDKGLIPIAFAYRKAESLEVSEDGLHLLALVGLKYLCHEVTKSAVEDLMKAGVMVKLLSDDELSAARAIAYELGIFQPDSIVDLEGEEIRDLSTIRRLEDIDMISVIANSLPAAKLLVVQCLQEKGHVVAFFGGLTTSDAPVLKEADVGITEKDRSTEMARECSDIVTENGFRSLMPILIAGRSVYYNIQKFTQLQLTASISGLLINFVAAMCLWESPISAIQLIWVYFIMCILGHLMMVMESKSQEAIADPPVKRTQSLVTKAIWKNIATQALYQAFMLLILNIIKQAMPRKDEDVWKGMIFNSFMLCQVFNQLNAMDIFKKKAIKILIKRYSFWVGLGAVMVMQVLVVEFANSLADCVRLNGVEWAFCLIIAAVSWGIEFAVMTT